MVETFRTHDVRTVVALQAATAKTVEEALTDPQKAAVYSKFMDKKQIPMASIYELEKTIRATAPISV